MCCNVVNCEGDVVLEVLDCLCASCLDSNSDFIYFPEGIHTIRAHVIVIGIYE